MLLIGQCWVKVKVRRQKVKAALPKVSSEEVQRFAECGKITVDGIDLVTEDLQVQRGLPASKAEEGQEFRSHQDVLIILDVNLHPELESEGLARELINRIQRLRKKAGLNTTDDVQVQYRVVKDTIDLPKVIKDNEELLLKSTKYPIEELKEAQDLTNVITDEEQTINDTVFNLRLLKI